MPEKVSQKLLKFSIQTDAKISVDPLLIRGIRVAKNPRKSANDPRNMRCKNPRKSANDPWNPRCKWVTRN